MKFFVAAYAHADESESPAELGEIVIPDFNPGSYGFISVETLKKSPGAMVMEVDRDPDEVFEKFKDSLPGIPEDLLREWFVKSVTTAHQLGDRDVIYSSRVEENRASVLDPELGISHEVWVDIDPTDYLS